MNLSSSLPAMGLSPKHDRYQRLERSVLTMQCRQRRRRRTGVLRPGATLPLVSKKVRPKSKSQRPISKSQRLISKSKRTDPSGDVMQKTWSRRSKASSGSRVTADVGTTVSPANKILPEEDVSKLCKRNTASATTRKTVQRLQKRVVKLSATYNTLVGQIIEAKETRDDLLARRNQIKQQQTNVQLSRDQVSAELERLRKKERAMWNKVKQAEHYSKVLLCMRDRQTTDFMNNKKLYERYTKLSTLCKQEEADSSKMAIESSQEKERTIKMLAKVQRRCDAEIRAAETTVEEAKVFTGERSRLIAGVNNERTEKVQQEHEQDVLGVADYALRKIEDKIVVQKTLQLKNHYELHLDSFRDIWLATGLEDEQGVIERFNNQDAYIQEAQAVVHRLQLQVFDMMDANEETRHNLQQEKCISSELESTPRWRLKIEGAKAEDVEPQSEVWWGLELSKALQELSTYKKIQQTRQYSKLRVRQFSNLLHWTVRGINPNGPDHENGEQEQEEPGVGERKADEDADAASDTKFPVARLVERNFKHILPRITYLADWLLSDTVHDLIQRARQDPSLRWKFRPHPSNARVEKGDGYMRFDYMRHIRNPSKPRIQKASLKGLEFTQEIDDFERFRMNKRVMNRRDVKNMSLTRFRVCMDEKPLEPVHEE